MRNLCIISKESIFAGFMKTSTCETVDSLANSLTSNYNVNVISIKNKFSLAINTGTLSVCKNRITKIRFSKVTYYLIEFNYWDEKVIELLNELQPQIIHNFAEPNIITKINYKPEKSVYTLTNDSINSEFIYNYDFITSTIPTNSNNILYTPNGLLELATPKSGLLLSAPYNSTLMNGKTKNKTKLASMYDIPTDNYICLVAGLFKEPDILDDIINNIPYILDTNGAIIFATKNNDKYFSRMQEYENNNRVVFFKKDPSIAILPLLLAGSDFYMHPINSKMSNLIPLLVSAYGTIPIMPNNEDFDNNNIIVNNNDYVNAIYTASDLYFNKPEVLLEMRKNLMNSIPSWNERKQQYIELYEK